MVIREWGSIEMRRKWDGVKNDVAQECGLHYWSSDLCSELNLYAPWQYTEKDLLVI